MNKPPFVEGQIYHIFNRGVEKRDVFLGAKDYHRFVHDLFEFNDERPVLNSVYYFDRKNMEVQPQYFLEERKPRKLLVKILAFVLMPNHFHLLLQQAREGGIVHFMQKLGTGYTMYFNQKYERVGGLFQGRYKAIRLAEERHFIYLPFYIHANPLKFYRGSTSIDGRVKFLMDYRWSSFADYSGKKNFPSVTSRDFLLEYFGGEKKFVNETRSLLKSRTEVFEDVRGVSLDNDFDD